MNTKLNEYLSSPLNLSLLLLIFTIVISTASYVVFPELKYKVFSFIAVGFCSFMLGRIYKYYVKVNPSKIFRKVVALYYLLFSRVWVVVLSVIFVNNYYDLLAVEGIGNVTMLIVFSIASLFITYYMVYYLFGAGAKMNFRVGSKNPVLPEWKIDQ